MGNINKYSNLYNKDNEIIKSVNDKGILTDYSIKELEDLVDSLDDGNEKNNAMSILQQMYTNPKTKEDKEYVDQMRKDLLERLKANTSTKKEDVVKSLGEVEEALTKVVKEQKQEENPPVIIVGNKEAEEKFNKAVNEELVNSLNTNDEYTDYEEVKDDSSTNTGDEMLEQIKYEYKYPYTNEKVAKQFEKMIKDDFSTKMDNDIKQKTV